MVSRELVLYSRSLGCPFITVVKQVLGDYGLPYREILIDQNELARQRILQWTGFLSVPTLVIADAGSDLPYRDPSPLPAGTSPRGIHRGSMITEPSADQLAAWLAQNGFIQESDLE